MTRVHIFISLTSDLTNEQTNNKQNRQNEIKQIRSGLRAIVAAISVALGLQLGVPRITRVHIFVSKTSDLTNKQTINKIMQIRLQQGVPKITRAYIYSPFMSVTSHLTNKLTKQNNLIYHSLRDQISAEGNCCLSDFSRVSHKYQGLEMVVKWNFVGPKFWATPSTS
jgi:hypothetical protein